MDRSVQQRKAEDFLALHHGPKLLVLPNVWDPLGARMLVSLGYPAVATASAAVAYSLGYLDGEQMPFATMLEAVGKIAASVDVPVTADIESGYAESPEGVAENMRRVLHAGAVGINLEDTVAGEGGLYDPDAQCARIRAVRRMAHSEGVPLVINARTDVYLRRADSSPAERLAETIARARAYLAAGADCIYPIMLGDVASLRELHAAIEAPINVYAAASAAPMGELEAAGIRRLSLGPGLLKASLTAMKQVAEEVRGYGSYKRFTDGALGSDEIEGWLAREPPG